MALGMTVLTSGGSNVDGSNYDTASAAFDTHPNELILGILDVSKTSAEPNTPALTATGLTWELHTGAAVYYKTTGTAHLKLFIFRAVTGASPTAGAVDIDFGGVTQTGARWDVIAVSGAPLGNNGADAIIQVATNSGQVDDGVALSISLSAAGHADNRPFGCFGLNFNNPAIGHRTNWTELSDDAHGTPSQDLETQWRPDAFETTASGTNDSGLASIFMGGVALEVAAAQAAGSGTVPLQVVTPQVVVRG